jgi:hypothetical protein
MIDIGKILKRAWHILWNYRILWIFGLLLAVTAGGGRISSNAGSSGTGYRFNAPNNYNPNYQPGVFVNELNQWFQQNVDPLFTYPAQHIATFVWIGVGLLLLILVVGSIAAILRYVSEIAVIRMVDGYEQTGEKVGFRQGWRLGWTRRAFRLWLIDLLIGLPVIVVLLLVGLLGVAVFFSVRAGSGFVVPEVIAAVGCFFLFLLASFLWALVVGILRVFFARAAALEDTGVWASFRSGWQTFRRNWKSALLMWLVVLGIGIGVGLVSFVLFIVLIPVYILTAIIGLIVAAIPGGIAFGIAMLFGSWPVALIIAVLLALPLFFMVTFSPLIFFGGLVEVFNSSVWTLTYREMKALEALSQSQLAPPVA